MATRSIVTMTPAGRWILVAAVAATGFSAAAQGQNDGCRGALGALNRVKEEIRPDLSVASTAGKERLGVMQSALENATRFCKDKPELWFYRAMISERLGDQRDVTYSRSKLEDLDTEREFQHHFDPFSLPPAAFSLAQAGTTANAQIRTKWALVVGIDHFQDPRARPLSLSVKDSRDMVAYLEDPKGGRFDSKHVLHLENEQATLLGVREALGKLRSKAGPDDLIVVYFSGHGSPRGFDANGVSYILLYDTKLDDEATLYASALQMIDLVQLVNREFKARHVVLLLDTCYSGDALSKEDGGSRGFGQPEKKIGNPAPQSFSGAFQTLKLGYGRAVMTASRGDERSWEDEQINNGFFTHFLLQTLKENQGKDDLLHVFPKVQKLVFTGVQARFGVSQTPSFEYSESGDSIVLAADQTDRAAN